MSDDEGAGTSGEAYTPRPRGLLAVALHLALRGRCLHAARGGRRGRLRLRRVLALRHDEGVGAVRPRLPLLAQRRVELVVGLLLVLRVELLLDRRRRLLQRLLLGGGDLLHLEDVVAELRLDGAGERALLRGEDRVVEGLLLRALGDAQQRAALALGRLVDRVPLRDGGPALAGLERLLGRGGLGLVLRQDDAQVTRGGRREARLVLGVEVGDGLVGDLGRVLDGLLAQLRV